MTTITEALTWATARLSPSSESPRLDAEMLLAEILKKKRAFLYTYPEVPINDEAYTAFEAHVHARNLGAPIAYITNKREFWSLPFMVTEATLIPRPETELLVEKTLELIDAKTSCKLLELGTGSGAIACALAKERPHWQIIATDVSAPALQVAKFNAETLGLKNIVFIQSDWFSEVADTDFDVILSNPPYLGQSDPHLHVGDLRFEPQSALVSGPNGLESLQSIIEHSYNHLVPNGVLLLEHGYQQGLAVVTLLNNRGFKEIQCAKDLQQHDRVSYAKKTIMNEYNQM